MPGLSLSVKSVMPDGSINNLVHKESLKPSYREALLTSSIENHSSKDKISTKIVDESRLDQSRQFQPHDECSFVKRHVVVCGVPRNPKLSQYRLLEPPIRPHFGAMQASASKLHWPRGSSTRTQRPSEQTRPFVVGCFGRAGHPRWQPRVVSKNLAAPPPIIPDSYKGSFRGGQTNNIEYRSRHFDGLVASSEAAKDNKERPANRDASLGHQQELVTPLKKPVPVVSAKLLEEEEVVDSLGKVVTPWRAPHRDKDTVYFIPQTLALPSYTFDMVYFHETSGESLKYIQ